MFDPTTLLLLAALAAPPSPAAHVPTANDSVLASVVGPLIKPGDRVRVRSDLGSTQGAAGLVDPLGIRLKIEADDIWSQPHTRSFAWSGVERIDVHTAHAGNAAKVGAAFGCLVGLGMIASAAAYASAYGSGPGAAGLVLAFAAGGVAGGCVGGLAGGLVGSLLPAWKTVYERR